MEMSDQEIRDLRKVDLQSFLAGAEQKHWSTLKKNELLYDF